MLSRSCLRFQGVLSSRPQCLLHYLPRILNSFIPFLPRDLNLRSHRRRGRLGWDVYLNPKILRPNRREGLLSSSCHWSWCYRFHWSGCCWCRNTSGLSIGLFPTLILRDDSSKPLNRCLNSGVCLQLSTKFPVFQFLF